MVENYNNIIMSSPQAIFQSTYYQNNYSNNYHFMGLIYDPSTNRLYYPTYHNPYPTSFFIINPQQQSHRSYINNQSLPIYNYEHRNSQESRIQQINSQLEHQYNPYVNYPQDDYKSNYTSTNTSEISSKKENNEIININHSSSNQIMNENFKSKSSTNLLDNQEVALKKTNKTSIIESSTCISSPMSTAASFVNDPNCENLIKEKEKIKIINSNEISFENFETNSQKDEEISIIESQNVNAITNLITSNEQNLEGVSFGTMFHSKGTCNSCRFEWTKGCHMGLDCRFCHHESHSPDGRSRVLPNSIALVKTQKMRENLLNNSSIIFKRWRANMQYNELK